MALGHRFSLTRRFTPAVICTVILCVGLAPLFYEEELLGRRLPASMEMLYTLVVIHVSLFVIRKK
ncbi:hypothetical protein [Candidatus Nitrospira bockiana]